jgi:hypothetical protein
LKRVGLTAGQTEAEVAAECHPSRQVVVVVVVGCPPSAKEVEEVEVG